MVGGDAVQFVKLFAGSEPHRRIFGFVPNLPIFDVPMMTVSPAFIVVSDYMFANARPLGEILWRINVVRLDPIVIFNRRSEAIIDAATGVNYRFKIFVGKCKVVVFGVGFVCIEIREDIGDVNKMSAAPCSVGVMGAHKWDAGVLKFFLLAAPCVIAHRSIVDSVKGLNAPGTFAKINAE